MIKQVAVFLENREGRVSECCKVLHDADVNLRSLSIADTKEFGIVRMITDDNEKAVQTLKAAGFLSSIVELVGIEVPDRAGALAELLIALYEGGVNIEYMYACIGKLTGKAIMVIRTDNPDLAAEVLENNGYADIKPEEVYRI